MLLGVAFAMVLPVAVPGEARAADADTLAADSFTRTSAQGWRQADVGGAYAISPDSSNVSVDGNAGVITLLQAGVSRSAALDDVSARDARLTFRIKTDKKPTGAGQFAYATLRHVSEGTEYRVRVRLATDGSVWGRVERIRSGVTFVVGAEARLQGVQHTPGASLWVRARVRGADPTSIHAKVWSDGQARPAGWTIRAEDSGDDIRGTGALGVRVKLPNDSSNHPVAFTFDDLVATDASKPVVDQNPLPLPTQVHLLDRFDRETVNGWGAAAGAPTYSVYGTSADYSVQLQGAMRLATAGRFRAATLATESLRDADISFRVQANARPVGGSLFAYSAGRVIGTSEYRSKVCLLYTSPSPRDS